MDTDEEVSYRLLGAEEVDVKNGTISVFSPLGRSILGKVVGDEVVVKTPGGTREFELIEIRQSKIS